MTREELVNEISGIIFLNIGDHDHKRTAKAVVSYLDEKRLLKPEKSDEAALLESARRIMDRDGIL